MPLTILGETIAQRQKKKTSFEVADIVFSKIVG